MTDAQQMALFYVLMTSVVVTPLVIALILTAARYGREIRELRDEVLALTLTAARHGREIRELRDEVRRSKGGASYVSVAYGGGSGGGC